MVWKVWSGLEDCGRAGRATLPPAPPLRHPSVRTDSPIGTDRLSHRYGQVVPSVRTDSPIGTVRLSHQYGLTVPSVRSGCPINTEYKREINSESKSEVERRGCGFRGYRLGDNRDESSKPIDGRRGRWRGLSFLRGKTGRFSTVRKWRQRRHFVGLKIGVPNEPIFLARPDLAFPSQNMV